MSTNFFQDLNPRLRRKRGKESFGGRDEHAALRKLIGARFRAARKLNGWDQTEAAERFGYRNSTQISLVEDGTRFPTHECLEKAWRIYGVSLDYLFGLTEEPERDMRLAERQAAMAQVQHLLTSTAQLMTTQLQKYLSGGAPAVASSRTLLSQAQECIDSVQRFRDLNREAFDEDMRGSAKVMASIDALAREVIRANQLLERYDRVAENLIATVEQRIGATHPLFDASEQG